MSDAEPKRLRSDETKPAASFHFIRVEAACAMLFQPSTGGLRRLVSFESKRPASFHFTAQKQGHASFHVSPADSTLRKHPLSCHSHP